MSPQSQLDLPEAPQSHVVCTAKETHILLTGNYFNTKQIRDRSFDGLFYFDVYQTTEK